MLTADIAPLECTYFLDILSQWCFVADEALAKLRSKYGKNVNVSYRFVPIAFKGELPVTRSEQIVAYERSAMITGVKTVPWIEEHQAPNTWEANATAPAAAHLGFDLDEVRKAIARAALLRAEPMGRPGAAMALVSQTFGIHLDELETLVHSPQIAAEMQAAEDEFKALHLRVRPTFLLRNGIEDHIILGGAWRFDLLEQCAQRLIDDDTAYKIFAERNPGRSKA